MKKKTTIMALCLLALTACADVEGPTLSLGGLAGAVVGGVAGGVAGAQFGGGIGQTLFMGTGALAGAAIGYDAGSILMPSDQAAYDGNARTALNQAADGDVRSWSNPETGNGGIFTPTASYLTVDGRSCRTYRATLALKNPTGGPGVIARRNGAACQQADGSWRSVDEDFS